MSNESNRPLPTGAELSAEVNAEIELAMKEMNAEATPPKASGKPSAIRGPRVVQAGREVRPGKVVSVGPADVFLEFGPKDLGVVPRLQWVGDAGLPAVGDVIEVVVNPPDQDGLRTCVLPGSVQKADWELLEPGQVIEARVTGSNKGGLELEVAGHRAFMPAGQIGGDHVADLSVFVGEKLTCEVTRIDRSGKGNIVLSRRSVLARERREQAEKVKAALAEGQIVEGTVRKIMPFGCFVDLGGVDGLVHVSDLTHDRAGHGEKFVSRYVKEGEKVRVQVLKIDWAADRLSLGIKQIQQDPFAQAAGDIKEGVEVTGRVKNIVEFGAFIEISPGVEGLVHISELAWRRVGKVDEVLKPDEVIKAKVLKIDPETRRISLSIKALTPPPEPQQGSADGPSKGGRPGMGKGGRRGREVQGRSLEEISKVTPELRRLREKFGGQQLKGGIG
ncbi:MAG: S1 RNA-binding domain-containing protein [Phycisphaerae bacterium]|nr:S1 RNA-binding domain-containing protein [Phycisphaerae bacterium]